MNNEDYIVLNKDGDYWTGSGWSELPQKAVDLTIKDAVELAVENLPSDILIGDGEMIRLWLGFAGDGLCLYVDYPSGMSQYTGRAEAIAAIMEYTGS